MNNDGMGDILLGGTPFRIDIGTWREKDVIDFSPRASVPGGSTIMSDLGLFQPLVQTDWQHGFGFHWYLDAQGYMQTIGNIDTRQDGLVILFTKSVSSETDNNAKQGFTTFNNAVYAWGTAGLRKYDGASWSSIYSTNPVNFALNAGDYLLFCPDGARIQKMDTAGTVTNAGLDANSTDYKWMVIHNGLLYAAKDATNIVHYDDSPAAATLEGTTADTNIIYCGIGNIPTTVATVFAGNLYVGRNDGLWVIGEDDTARRVIDYSTDSSPSNFRSMVVVNGYLIFPIRDRIIQWNGARVADMTPEKITDSFPYITYGRFDNFVVHDNFLFCTGRTNETTYTESLLVWDGVAWHKLMDLVTSTADSVTAMGFDAVNNRLWYHVDATADATYYIQFQDNSAFPYGNFPTTGQHSLITSRMDMGFRRIQKSLNSLIMETANCTATRYIRIYYQLDDDGTWVLWDTITKNGVTEVYFPGGQASREFNFLTFRFDFVTADATQSPILEGYTMRFIMRPNVLWGLGFDILTATDLQNSVAADPRTQTEIRQSLFDLRNTKKPVSLVDPFGVAHFGYLTSVQGTVSYRAETDTEEYPDIEMRYMCNFAELTNAYDNSTIRT